MYPRSQLSQNIPFSSSKPSNFCQKRNDCRCCEQVGKQETPSPSLGTFLVVSLQACASHVHNSAHQPRCLGHFYASSTSWYRDGDQGDKSRGLAAMCRPLGAVGRGGGAGATSLLAGGAWRWCSGWDSSCFSLSHVTVHIVFLGTVHP